MRRFFAIAVMVLAALTGFAQTRVGDGGGTAGVKLFESNTDSVTPVNPTHRIPALARVKDKALVAISDERYSTYGADIGAGRIDLVCRVSTDDGKTWSAPTTIVRGTGGTGPTAAYGDAAVVSDRETGQILVMAATGGIGFFGSTVADQGGTPDVSQAIRISRITGEMDQSGHIAWSEISDLSPAIYSLYLNLGPTDDAKNPDGKASLNDGLVSRAFFSSGRICQSRFVKNGDGASYRLYASLTTNRGALVVCSDDFGQTWMPLGGAAAQPVPRGYEAKTEELPSGDVLLSTKRLDGSGRSFSIFHYTDVARAAGHWAPFATLNDTTMPAARCNGDVLLVSARDTKTGQATRLMLLSAPASNGQTMDDRKSVTIYYKTIDHEQDCATPEQFATAARWDGSYRVSSTSSAYSTMQQTAAGDIAFLYEENNYRHAHVESYDIVYRRLTLADITGGRYTSVKP